MFHAPCYQMLLLLKQAFSRMYMISEAEHVKPVLCCLTPKTLLNLTSPMFSIGLGKALPDSLLLSVPPGLNHVHEPVAHVFLLAQKPGMSSHPPCWWSCPFVCSSPIFFQMPSLEPFSLHWTILLGYNWVYVHFSFPPSYCECPNAEAVLYTSVWASLCND